MNVRILTAAEDAYVAELATRMLSLQSRIGVLMKQPLTDYDPESGMLVCHAAGTLLWAMAWMNNDLLEAIS